jgi:hypothetical protein
MTWTLTVARDARKAIGLLSGKDRERILAALVEMRDDPFSGDLKRLRNLSPAFPRNDACRCRRSNGGATTPTGSGNAQ